MSPIGDDQLAPITPNPRRRKAEAKQLASTKKHAKPVPDTPAERAIQPPKPQSQQSRADTPAESAKQPTCASTEATQGQQVGKGDRDSLPLHNLRLSKTSGPKPRAELTAHVTLPTGTKSRIHIVTLYAASWGAAFHTDAIRIKDQIVMQGLSKLQALQVRDGLRAAVELDIE